MSAAEAVTGSIVQGRTQWLANCLVVDVRLPCHPEHAAAHQELAEMVVRILNDSMDLLRWRGRQYYVEPIEARSLPWLCELLDDAGMPSGEFATGQMTMTMLTGFVTTQAWERVGLDLSVGDRVPLPDALLLDARSRMPDVRSRLLLTWTALEVFIRSFCDQEAAARAIDPMFWKWLSSRDDDIDKQPSVPELFDEVLRLITGSSLKRSQPSLWEQLIKLKRVRNAIAHEGLARYRQGRHTIEVDDNEATRLMHAAVQIVDWARGLRGDTAPALGPEGARLWVSIVLNIPPQPQPPGQDAEGEDGLPEPAPHLLPPRA
jgi:hypothetical protein